MAGPVEIGPADAGSFDAALADMGGQGYRRAHRIRRRGEFLAVQQGATSRIRTASLLVLARLRSGSREVGAAVGAEAMGEAAPGATLATPPLPTRLGVVASRRIGNAVHRNRAKRLIREAFRRCRADLPAAIDIVIIANQAAPTRSLADLEREMSRVVRDLRRAFRARRVAEAGGPG